MLAKVDYIGLATLVSALSSGFVAILAAFHSAGARRSAEAVRREVETPDGQATVGTLAADNHAQLADLGASVRSTVDLNGEMVKQLGRHYERVEGTYQRMIDVVEAKGAGPA